mgnify:CR=1 FL=1
MSDDKQLLESMVEQVRDDAIEGLIKALIHVREDCRMALDGTWDRSDDGFIAMEENVTLALALANGINK